MIIVEIIETGVLVWLVLSVQRLNSNFVEAAEDFWRRGIK